jgi:gamma-glutamylcyclotransferase (GGCT)/AIG2-like uncharacterized protein YtfP
MQNIRMESEVHPRFYFGYGSNLDMGAMKRRCPDSSPVCAATLPDYRLTFSGVLTIEHNHPGEHVVGGIFVVSEKDIYSLDCYEGFPHLYIKRYTHAKIQGKREEVFYYVMPEGEFQVSPPSQYYYDVCKRGYQDFGLDVAELDASVDRAYEAYEARGRVEAAAGGLGPIQDPEVDLSADLDWTPRA